MKQNTLKININKPSQVVYDFYVNPKNTPLWVDSIVREETSEWPIRVGTVYRNQNKAGVWTEYTVTNLKENEVFELTMKDGNYHVRYTHRELGGRSSELEYFEWVNEGDLEEPFTMEILEKLKVIVEQH